MSETVRTLLADAASTVEGVHVTPYYRQITRTGSGVVRRDSTNYPNAFGGVVTWQVFVVLPADHAEAERWYDEHALQLVDALATELAVTRAEPSTILLADGQAVPIVLIQGTREEA